MSFLKKIINGGEVLETINSPINGKIEVFRELSGGISLRCGGVVQSGGLVGKLWEKGVKEISKFKGNGQVKKCLILGLGAGTLVKLLSEEFPECKITGIEIDPLMIKAGEKHFDLKSRDLKIINSDAFEALKEMKEKYDLVVVDLYNGQEFPEKAEEESFFRELLGVLDKCGIVVFNSLNYNPGHKERTYAFGEKVKKSFKRIKEASVVTNLLILASN